jgi:hypothetical protein
VRLEYLLFRAHCPESCCFLSFNLFVANADGYTPDEKALKFFTEKIMKKMCNESVTGIGSHTSAIITK